MILFLKVLVFVRNFPPVDVVGSGFSHLLLHVSLLLLPILLELFDVLYGSLSAGDEQDCGPLLYLISLFLLG